MGACEFSATAYGKDAKEAFGRAVDQAEYDHGHSGYTGTIAEKREFHCFGKVTSLDEALVKARTLESQVDDKWGPAGCIEIAPSPRTPKRLFYFFGWASS